LIIAIRTATKFTVTPGQHNEHRQQPLFAWRRRQHYQMMRRFAT